MARWIHSSSTAATAMAALAMASMMATCLLMVAPIAVEAGIPVCENHGSRDVPYADATSFANTLIGYPAGTQCCQTNNGGNFCTVMLFTGPYQVRICGPFGQCMPCADAGGLTYEIRNACQRNDNGVVRVSGTNFKAPFTIVLRNQAD